MRLLFLLSMLVPVGHAAACSCVASEPAGFVHANATLPGNARGALFMPPRPASGYSVEPSLKGWLLESIPAPVRADQFQIISAGRVIRASIDWVGVPMPERAYRFSSARLLDAYRQGKLNVPVENLIRGGQLVDASREWSRATGLIRVAPAEGFRRGATYLIRWLGKAEAVAYPLSTTFQVDHHDADVRTGTLALMADGAPRRQMLSLPADASCDASSMRMVQRFHYVLPPALERFRPLIAYVPAQSYQPDLCSEPGFAQTAEGDGKDFVHVECRYDHPPMQVTGKIGLFEVDDALRTTPALQVNFREAVGLSCSAKG